MRKLRGLIIGILTALLMAGCIYTSALADDSSSVPNNWGGDMMGLTQAKASVDALINDGVKLPEIKVAVIDTGANANHDLLKGRILPSSKSFINSDTSDYSDQNGHGTHVAGIIAQNTPSNVKILVLQALDQNKKGDAENIAQAINYAVSQGADIINLSLGMSKAAGAQVGASNAADETEEAEDDAEYRAYVATISEVITQAKSAGCLIIAAAGNSEGGRDLAESQTYPAVSDDVITVSAISENKSLYENSNYGEAVDFCAPGEDIYSAGISSNTALEHLSGTSMAAPFISSAFAMLKLYNPKLSIDELTSKLQSDEITEDVGDVGNDLKFGYGLPVFKDGIIPCTKLPKPEIKKTTSDGETITLEWDAASYLTYDVYRRESGIEEFTCIANGLPEGKFVDENVILGTTYEYYIEAPNGVLILNEICSDVVAVRAYVAVTGVHCANNNASLVIGEQYQMDVEVYPENATDKKLVYKSGNDGIATVNETGLITAISPGYVLIRVSTPDREVGSGCYISVRDPSDNKCGENAVWDLNVIDGKTVLTISGTGDMYDYTSSEAPFHIYKDIIQKIVVGDGITRIGNKAFHDMESLCSVEGMNDIISVGQSAFGNCRSLEYIELKDRLEKLGNYAFHNTGLKSITFGSGLTTIPTGAFESCLFTELVLPDGLKSIENHSFRSNRLLQSVIVPEGVESIGDQAFHNCVELKTIVLPESMKTLDTGCFNNTALSEVFLPNQVSYIGNNCLRTRNLQSIIVGEKNPYFCSEDGVLFNKEKTVLVLFPCAREGEYVVPDSVREIGAGAFSENRVISKVVLPEGITTIDTSAFYLCKNLKEVNLPDSLTTINKGAFRSSGIIELRLPSFVMDIKTGAFQDCEQLKTVYIPFSVKEIDNTREELFLYCNHISDVFYEGFSTQFHRIENIEKETNLIKDDVTLHIQASGTAGDGIKWKAEGVSGDVTITISGNGAMPEYADPKDAPWYDGKDEITHVVIEDGVTKVGKNSFFRYDKIEDVTLPESAEEIGRDAFRGCSALESFIYSPEGLSDEYKIEPQFLVSLYTGSDIKPRAFVSLAGTELQEKIDYKVSYKNNTQIGTAMIEVTFIGAHADKGTVRIPFTITDKLMDGENIKALSSITLAAVSYEYNGSARKPSAVVKSGRWVLKENADYKLDYSTGRTNIGTYKVVASGIGAYTGTKWDSFEITPKSIAGFSATLSATSYTYDGKTKKPSVSVSGLTANDYSVSYSDNTEVGTGKVTITGKGNYTGQKELTFTIKEAHKTDPETSGTNGNNSNNAGSNKSGSKSSGKSSNASGAKASTRRTSSSTASTGILSSRRSSRTGTSTSSGITSSRSDRTTGARSTANNAFGQSKKNTKREKDKSTSETENNKDKKTETKSDIATKNNGLAKDIDIVHEVSTEKESSIPDTVKYIAAGLFLAVAAAGIVFLILMLKKKKKKAA